MTLSQRIGLSPITMLSRVYLAAAICVGSSGIVVVPGWRHGRCSAGRIAISTGRRWRGFSSSVGRRRWRVLCLASQGFKAAEHYWFTRDELGRMDPARPGSVRVRIPGRHAIAQGDAGDSRLRSPLMSKGSVERVPVVEHIEKIPVIEHKPLRLAHFGVAFMTEGDGWRLSGRGGREGS